MNACTCRPCPECGPDRVLCGACGRCTRHDRHAPDCPGCPAPPLEETLRAVLVPRRPRYTVDVGRQILRDGVRVATVYSKVQTGERNGLAPADADDFAHVVARALNLLEAGS